MVHDNIKSQSSTRPYFDIRRIKDIEAKYVCWLDVMGFANFLTTSSNKAAIVVGKLHEAIIRSKDITSFTGNIYPIIDGCYITSVEKREMFAIIKNIYRMISIQFILEEKMEHKFMARACISYGEIVEGSGLIPASHKFYENEFNKNYISTVLFGVPLTLSNKGEKFASPYGVWIDDSARQFAPLGGTPIRMAAWKWWLFKTGIREVDDYCDQIQESLKDGLFKYFDWCNKNRTSLAYSKEAIERHRSIAEEYFG